MSTETLEVTVIAQPELLQVVKNSKIDLNTAKTYALGYAPLMQEVLSQTDIIDGLDKENPLHAPIAKRASLDLGKILSRAGDKKKEDKETLLLVTRHIDNLFGVVETTGRLGQKDAKDIFEYQDRLEAERLNKLEAERKALLSPYGAINQFVDLKLMDAETFSSYLSKEKLAFEAKIEADAKAEKQRVADEKKALSDQKAKEKADKAERERIRKENEELKKVNEIREKLNDQFTKRINEITSAGLKFDFNTTYTGYNFFVDILDIKTYDDEKWNLLIEKIKSEVLRSETEAKIETEKQAKIQADLKAENDRIASELQLKKDAELKADKDQKAKVLAEQTERITKAKAALLAPEREKVKAFFTEFENLKFPNLTSEQGKAMAVRVNEALSIVRKLIISDSKNLL